MQILLYLGSELQSLVIMMSGCSATTWSSGSRWVETHAPCCRGWLQTDWGYKPPQKWRPTEDQSICQKKTRGIESWSYVNNYSIYHIRSNSSLILRCKSIFHKVVPKCPGQFGIGAEVSWVQSVLGPKCLGFELSWVWSVCRPFIQWKLWEEC